MSVPLVPLVHFTAPRCARSILSCTLLDLEVHACKLIWKALTKVISIESDLGMHFLSVLPCNAL